MVKRKSRNWIGHLIAPLLGIAALLAVLAQMSKVGLGVGISWMFAGFVVYLIIRRRAKRA
jgi:hypothetical protein